MGYANAQRAMTRWAHLDHRAARCLLVMALTARDKAAGDEPAGIYWGGHDLLAHAMGFTDWDTEPSESDLRMVRKAVADLVRAGAIKPVDKSHKGARAVYRLALDR